MVNLNRSQFSVNSKEDLANFIDVLKEDFLTNHSEWENATLDRFLDAMSAWVRAMDGYYKNTGKEAVTSASWAVFADILAAAKIYE